jgi:hypothetical protein
LTAILIILVILTPFAVMGAGHLVLCWAARRRDRAVALAAAGRRRARERAGSARDVHDRAYLDWLEQQFASKRSKP